MLIGHEPVRDEDGEIVRKPDGKIRYREQYRQVGVFDTKRERDRAVAEARAI